jgi:hypothetical protein
VPKPTAIKTFTLPTPALNRWMLGDERGQGPVEKKALAHLLDMFEIDIQSFVNVNCDNVLVLGKMQGPQLDNQWCSIHRLMVGAQF